jgi:hypothetical protein
MSYLKDREIWLSSVPTGNPPAGYVWVFIQNGVFVVRDSNGVDKIMATTTGTVTNATSASYVEYSNVANKPALISGSSQVSYTGLSDIPAGIVSGSTQVSFNGITDKPALVSSSAQIVGYNVFATTGSNQFDGSQAVTGSLTVTGQVVAQTLNVQQVTSSIVYSSGSNIFGNSLSNTQQFTGSVSVTGSLTVNGASTFNLGSGEMRLNRTGTSEYLKLNTYYLLTDGNDQLLGSVTGATSIYAGSGVSPKMTITSGGNVGIGTTDPGSLLEVVSTTFPQIRVSNFATTGTNRGSSFRVTSTTNGGTNFLGDFNAISNNSNAPYNSIDGIYLMSRTSGFPLVLTVNNSGTEISALTLASTGAATFSGQLSVGGGSTQSWAGGFNMINIGPGQTSVGAFYNSVAPTQRDFRVFNAMYFDGTNYRYNTTGTVANMFIVGNGGDGGINLFNAPSGTSGNNASLTSIFSVTAAGAATFLSSVTATSGFLSVDGFANKDANYITLRGGFSPTTSGGIGFKARDHSGDGNDDGLACYGHDGISLLTAQTEQMRITSGGNVLIGTTVSSSGVFVLEVGNGSSDKRIYCNTNSAFAIAVARSSNRIFYFGADTSGNGIFSNGSGTAVGTINETTGVYTTLSDVNKKKDFEESTIGLNSILGLKSTLYRMKSDNETSDKHLGFIAQEVKEFIPQAYVESGEDDDKFIGLNYNAIVAALVKSVQELKSENDNLKSRLEVLEQS